VSGGALLGMLLRRVLPEDHLSTDSKDVVKLGMGLLATMAALVLGLLIASAKSQYDAQRDGLDQISAKFVLLDAGLAQYGPEAAGARVGARAGKLAAAASLPAPTTNAAAFAKRLGNDVHLGEQRIIHRRMRKPYKKRMRMPSMLDPHLADIERWLAAEPRLTALAILGRLAEHCSEQFGPSQHTIVQRLLRSLRRKAAETIIPRTAEGAAPDGDPGTGGDAACDGHSATPPAPPILRSLTKPRTGRPSALYLSSESNILR
jgi:hypothetical protein